MKITIELFGQKDVRLSVEGVRTLSKTESKTVEDTIKDYLEKYTDQSILSL